VLTAADSNIIKTYVELGMDIIAEMAFDPVRDAALATARVGRKSVAPSAV